MPKSARFCEKCVSSISNIWAYVLNRRLFPLQINTYQSQSTRFHPHSAFKITEFYKINSVAFFSICPWNDMMTINKLYTQLLTLQYYQVYVTMFTSLFLSEIFKSPFPSHRNVTKRIRVVFLSQRTINVIITFLFCVVCNAVPHSTLLKRAKRKAIW